MKTLTASERSALIKLASNLPTGNPERRAILASLGKASGRGGGYVGNAKPNPSQQNVIQKFIIEPLYKALKKVKSAGEGLFFTANIMTDLSRQKTNKVYKRDAFGGKSELAGVPHAKISMSVDFNYFDGKKANRVGSLYPSPEFLISEDGATLVTVGNLYGMRTNTNIDPSKFGKSLLKRCEKQGKSSLDEWLFNKETARLESLYPDAPDYQDLSSALVYAGFWDIRKERLTQQAGGGGFRAFYATLEGVKLLTSFHQDVYSGQIKWSIGRKLGDTITEGTFPIQSSTQKNVDRWVVEIKKAVEDHLKKLYLLGQEILK